MHINNTPVMQDANVVLGLDRAAEAAQAGTIGDVAPVHFSLMGFQLDTSAWEQVSVPEIAHRLRAEGVHAAVLTPA